MHELRKPVQDLDGKVLQTQRFELLLFPSNSFLSLVFMETHLGDQSDPFSSRHQPILFNFSKDGLGFGEAVSQVFSHAHLLLEFVGLEGKYGLGTSRSTSLSFTTISMLQQ